MTKRILSGIQPTGSLHLGNYLGAVKNWVSMQSEGECLFCIVDMHAITVPQNPEALRRHTREVAALYLAAGIDPEKSSVFVQSMVPAHAELAWILNCFTPLGWLNRMTQFKEKAGKKKEQASLGLYGYPVLQAADILVYQATHVPVGEDQKQHIELARDIAGAFNRFCGEAFFTIPEPTIQKEACRIMSLRDGLNKMSKSDPSENSRISMQDDLDAIALKIRKCKTDSELLPGSVEGLEGRPEAKNLLSIYGALVGKSLAESCQEFSGQQFQPLKEALTQALNAHLLPIREQFVELLKDTSQLDKVLLQGAERARSIAEPVLVEAQKRVGYLKIPSA